MKPLLLVNLVNEKQLCYRKGVTAKISVAKKQICIRFSVPVRMSPWEPPATKLIQLW